MCSLCPQALAEAQESWAQPGWTTEYLHQRLAALPEPDRAWRERAPELLWAWACLLGDSRALERFDRECVLDLVPNLTALGLSGDECDEVLQQLRHKLLVAAPPQEPGLASYRGAGPLGGFARTVAVRLAVDLQRARGRSAEVSSEQALALAETIAVTDQELDYLRAECAGHLNRAVRAAWEALPAHQQLLLRQQVADGLGIAELGRIYGIHPATAARRCGTAREALIRETKRRLREQLGGGLATLSSVMRLLAPDAELPSVLEPKKS